MPHRFTLLSSIFLLTAACSAAPDTAVAAEKAPLRTITVQGEGKTTSAPDMAVLNLGVQTDANTAAEALSQNSAAMSSTIKQLKDLGVDSKDIQTSGLSINPRYDYETSRRKPRLVGYTASNQVSVKLRDLDKAGGIIDAAVKSGANSLSGISFAFSDPAPLKDIARKNAVANARAKATLLTDAAGVALGPVLTISEGYAVAPQPMMVARMESLAVDAVPLEAGESTISATVTIVFAIE